jgi:ABC-type transporter Mla MlaB component
MDTALADPWSSNEELGSRVARLAGSRVASVHLTESSRLIWARIAGRLCRSEVDDVCDALAGRAVRGQTVLDLRAVTEIDGAGVGCVLMLQAAAARTGGAVAVLAAGPVLEALRPLARGGRIELIDLVEGARLLLEAGG